MLNPKLELLYCIVQSILYGSSLNLIGWFQVTTAIGYILSWIPVGLSTSCVVDSLCRTMKWAGALRT